MTRQIGFVDTQNDIVYIENKNSKDRKCCNNIFVSFHGKYYGIYIQIFNGIPYRQAFLAMLVCDGGGG